jgi:hypothetical protein
VFAALLPWLTYFAGSPNCNERFFFGLPTWYYYLSRAGKMQVHPATDRCEVVNFQITDFTLIALALADIALRLSALVAVAYVVYGGVQFVLAQGEPDKTKKARQTVINALIGLGIALISTGFVAFVGARVG